MKLMSQNLSKICPNNISNLKLVPLLKHTQLKSKLIYLNVNQLEKLLKKNKKMISLCWENLISHLFLISWVDWIKLMRKKIKIHLNSLWD